MHELVKGRQSCDMHKRRKEEKLHVGIKKMLKFAPVVVFSLIHGHGLNLGYLQSKLTG